MELLKNNSKIENVSLLSVQGAFASLHDDEPVILTVQTMYDLLTLKNLLTSFELKHLGLTITLQTVDIEVIDVVPLVDLQNIYTYRLLCKKSNTDFTPKSWYKQQYITLNNRYGHLSGQLQVAEYQVTNLLGSYGSFSVDSDGDGLADGWNKRPNVDVYQLQNGVQYMRRTVQKNAVSPALSQSQTTPANLNDRFFVRASAKVSSTANDARPGVFYIASFNEQDVIWSNFTLTSYTVNSSSFETRYITFQVTDTSAVGVGVFGFYLEHTLHTLGSINEAWVDNVILVNLTRMGELPQALKQFFAPSNIQKWEDLATFGNTNVMCILKNANGNYIAKKGNDWLNDLIPYVENTAMVWMPVYL